MDYITRHHGRDADGNNTRCGAIGAVAFRGGEAWSVNATRTEVVDWRFALREWSCGECARLVQEGKDRLAAIKAARGE